MNITIFGGTGKTGLLLIEKALKSRHTVTVFARTPTKISIQHNNLKIVKGELEEYGKIEEAIKNADAVISVLGPTQKTKELAIANGIKNIVDAMQKNDVKRLIATATPAFKDSNDKFQIGFSFGIFMVKMLIKDSYNNIVLTGKYIAESGLDWTIVRLPMLSDKPANGKINAGYTGDGTVSLFSLSRADLADFLLQLVDNRKWLHKSPVISN
ncbi:NAD(P)-dependent oxidoreductase [Chitinophaga sp. CF418]|uniref:NAD(P)-dependent oxidoreductase n=1 Tax=Chitinophaga sp. CF418 TaxID=1855287 RepID=UPI00091ED872|nr:NAD(P)H-binding protein [Chitinophaga sp. CF418]SHN09258.1 NAD(P)H-binding [Chitinophaga sp. CF418]